MSSASDETAPTQRDSTSDLPIVGLGASAGGIGALQSFFANVSRDTGAAYVVILHLSPDHDSRLAEVLQATTKMRVTQVTERTRIESNHVYVIPPNRGLEIADGRLSVTEYTRVEQRRSPVDVFFRGLAESHGSRAACIVLSGTGTNGSAGLKRVKEMGGLAIAQDPEQAEYGDMPQNAIATGLVDFVLPVEDIPKKVAEYFQRKTAVEPADAEVPADREAIRDVLALLRVRTGHDFSNYKHGTLSRRIERRVSLHGLSSTSAYVRYAREHTEEPIALMRELLISVTNFFRDPEAYRALEYKIIPRLFHGKQEHDHLRVWVPGCATGEEAYSIGMLLLDHSVLAASPPVVQIFATDLDERAIRTAREAFYTDSEIADVPEERIHKYFQREAGGYRVRRDLRELVLFAPHNVIKDPPFSHLDLIACRNLLIYLNAAIQKRVLETFHFALRPGGFLFLGTSESPDGDNDLFLVVDRDAHIYESRSAMSRIPLPIGERTMPVAVRTPQQRLDEAIGRPPDRIAPIDLHQRLLEQYAPPSVVVTDEHNVIHVSERANRFMQVPPGEPSREIGRLVRPELRVDLRTALHQASHRRSSVEVRGIPMRVNGNELRVTITVRPILKETDPARGYFLILFEETTNPEPIERPLELTPPVEGASMQLEEELTRVRGQLRATIEQYETQVEEAKASNEELQAMNEELRSAAEELETSKEELQSVNEELTTVNQELKIKIEELGLTNNDFQNLINSTDIGTIFLDRSLRVKFSTPRGHDLFNLLPTDLGRPLSDLSNKLLYSELHDDVSSVLARLHTVEREVQSRDGRWFFTRVLPYRTMDDRIDGVVITSQDVTARHAAGDLQQKLARQQTVQIGSLLRRLVDSQEDQRARIGRDLHDQLGQQLTALRLMLERHKASCSTTATIDEAIAIAQKLDGDVDFLAWELRPTVLDDLGLSVALPRYLSEWSKRHQIPAQCRCGVLADDDLSDDAEVVFYRVAQEALNSVLKHAHATHVDVILEKRDSAVQLVIEDDGVGFEPADSDIGSKGLGLIGMRERAALIGATLQVESALGHGTTVFLRAPVGAPQEQTT